MSWHDSFGKFTQFPLQPRAATQILILIFQRNYIMEALTLNYNGIGNCLLRCRVKS